MNALTLICQTIIALAKLYLIAIGGIICAVLLFTLILLFAFAIYEKIN
jgi:hypothetical protein